MNSYHKLPEDNPLPGINQSNPDVNVHDGQLGLLYQATTDSSFTSTFLFQNDSSSVVIPYAERLETYIIPIVFLIIFIVGVFGNGTLVLIFIRHRVIRNVPNTYILSLALGDLLVIVSSVPFTSTVYTFESWPYGELICKISESAKDISIGVSVFTLTALSADRFFAIVDPLKKLHSSIGGRRATKFTVLVTVSIWIFSIMCAVPDAAFSYVREFKQDNVTLFSACYPYPERWPSYPKVMVVCKFFVYYTIPLIIISCFYVLMARHLIRSTRNLPGEAQGQLRQIKARRKVAKTVLAFVIIFAVCFFPQHMFLLWFYLNPTAEEDFNAFWHIFRIIGFCLSYLNSCVNPIALYFVSGTFRKYFDEYLYALCGMKSTRRYGSTAERSNRCGGSARLRGGTRGVCSDSDMRRDRIFWKSTNGPATLQMSMLKKPDPILTTECTVTTLLNGHEAKNHLI